MIFCFSQIAEPVAQNVHVMCTNSICLSVQNFVNVKYTQHDWGPSIYLNGGGLCKKNNSTWGGSETFFRDKNFTRFFQRQIFFHQRGRATKAIILNPNLK